MQTLNHPNSSTNNTEQYEASHCIPESKNNSVYKTLDRASQVRNYEVGVAVVLLTIIQFLESYGRGPSEAMYV